MEKRSAASARGLILVAIASASIVGAQAPDPERDFQVNTSTTGGQFEPRVAVEENGGFSAVWYTDNAANLDGDSRAVFARRFSSQGLQLGPDFVVNTYTTGSQSDATLACAPSENCLFVWDSLGQDGSRSGVFGQIMDGAGDPVGLEFQINQFTPEFQGEADIAAFPNGFIVVWESGGDQDGDRYGVIGRSFDNRARPLSAEVQVNTFTSGNQNAPSIAANSDTGFLVSWQSRDQDGSEYGIFAQLYNRDGSVSGAEFQVNTYTPDNQKYPAVASSLDRYLVVWRSEHDGEDTGIFGRFFDTAGAPLGGEFQVNTYTSGRQEAAAVGHDGHDGFVVVWTSEDQDGSQDGLFGQRYDREGIPMGGEFAVNLNTEGSQTNPSVAGIGSFVAVWENTLQDGDGRGITGRLFPNAECAGDCDGDLNVSISELVLGVNIALDRAEPAACPSLDQDESGTVAINELVQAVNNALQGCPV